MKKYLLLIFLLTACSNHDARQVTQIVYEGNIDGTIPIVLTTTQDGESAFGNVVYKSKGTPTTIMGGVSAKSARFQEIMGDGSVTGIYSLKPTADGW